jgi:hypothetical protein
MIWNQRYENYARFHGRAPQDQIEQDRRDWPGGSMVGFVRWNNDRLREAAEAIPEAFFMGKLVDHNRYDAWLTAWVDVWEQKP